MSSIEFVNINGDPWNPSSESVTKKPAKRPDQPDGYHKGFRVVGHAPGALEQAKIEREEIIALAVKKRSQGDASIKIPPQFNEDDWRRNGKKTSIRPKPYEIKESADLCAEIARKNGWQDVEVIELKKEARKPV